ncbi:hypothetical protein GCM10009613_13740 [Pseudonocardia kongjuensis]|uniref:Uncharacterized protein n=1 Tax=Pseudonocardia kongjuensis TaxID=102227 RepID=A0ABN1XK72_9PSEU
MQGDRADTRICAPDVPLDAGKLGLDGRDPLCRVVDGTVTAALRLPDLRSALELAHLYRELAATEGPRREPGSCCSPSSGTGHAVRPRTTPPSPNGADSTPIGVHGRMARTPAT